MHGSFCFRCKPNPHTMNGHNHILLTFRYKRQIPLIYYAAADDRYDTLCRPTATVRI